ITVEDGDTYGEMKVESTSDKIIMKNDDSISLSRDKTISIMGDIKFKVADSNTVRYYPFVEVTTDPNDALNISMITSVKQGDSVTITVTSRGAVISDAEVNFGDENIGSTSSEGTITYKPPLSGKFTVTAEKEGYVSATGKIEVISLMDETKKMSIEISPDAVYEGTQITISTIKSIGGEAVEGVDVSYDGKSIGITSSDGTLSYTVKESGMHKLIATKTGQLDAELNLEVLALKAKFEFSNLVISPLEVKAGKDVIITLNATNTGKAEGEYNVDLMINGNLTESRKITLEVNESTTIEFIVAKDEPGTYTVKVNDLSGTFEVLEKSGIILYILGLLGVFALAAVAYMFTVGGWTLQMVSEKISGFFGSVR
ncbi:MAG: S-layer protein domain-containing protein, partial [Methanosarcinaceae archaeon]